MQKAIVVIMAHADDIEWSAGGTLAKYIAQGYRALYGVLSRCNSGWTSTEEKGGHYVPSRDIVPQRRSEAAAAAKVFGADLYYGDLLENCYTSGQGLRLFPSFTGPRTFEGRPAAADDAPDGTLMAVAAGAGEPWDGNRAVKEVTDLLIAWQPELVIGQEVGNLNMDHFAAAQLVAMAWQHARAKVELGPYWLPAPRAKEGQLPFPPFQPTHFVDVSGHEETALRAL